MFDRGMSVIQPEFKYGKIRLLRYLGRATKCGMNGRIQRERDDPRGKHERSLRPSLMGKGMSSRSSPPPSLLSFSWRFVASDPACQQEKGGSITFSHLSRSRDSCSLNRLIAEDVISRKGSQAGRFTSRELWYRMIFIAKWEEKAIFVSLIVIDMSAKVMGIRYGRRRRSPIN
jgi:hypothetical protein